MGKIVRVSAGRRATNGGKDMEERTGKPGRKDRQAKEERTGKDRQANEERTGKPRKKGQASQEERTEERTGKPRRKDRQATTAATR
jgi:hypothetical protein